jgi:teichuronic acid exporter
VITGARRHFKIARLKAMHLRTERPPRSLRSRFRDEDRLESASLYAPSSGTRLGPYEIISPLDCEANRRLAHLQCGGRLPQRLSSQRVKADGLPPALSDPSIIAASVAASPNPPTTASIADRRKVDRSLVSGLVWTSGAKWSAQAFTWAVTIFVARRLVPTDYGIYGLATLYLGIVQLFNDGGIGIAIVQRTDLDDERRAQLGGVSVLLGIGFLLLTLLVAPLVAMGFREERLGPVLSVLSLTFVGTGLQVLPRSLWQRALHFKRVALLDLTDSLIGSIATLVFAILGYGYWSLVYGTLTRVTITTGLALLWSRSRPSWPAQLERLRGPLTFGWHFLLARLAWYGYSNADFAIIGRRLGTAALGTYTLGWTLSSMAVDKIAAITSQVVGPVFASVQHQPVELRRYFLRLSEILALVTLPISAGIAWVAYDLVATLLGAKWMAAALPLRILAAYMGLRSLTILASQVMFATGNGRYGWRYNAVALCLLPPLFLIGTRWGAPGVAAAWVVGYPFIAWLFYRLIFRIIACSWMDYLRALGPALTGTGAMLLVLGLVRAFGLEGIDSRLRLILEIGIGAAAYGIALAVFARDRIKATMAFAMGLRSR